MSDSNKRSSFETIMSDNECGGGGGGGGGGCSPCSSPKRCSSPPTHTRNYESDTFHITLNPCSDFDGKSTMDKIKVLKLDFYESFELNPIHYKNIPFIDISGSSSAPRPCRYHCYGRTSQRSAAQNFSSSTYDHSDDPLLDSWCWNFCICTVVVIVVIVVCLWLLYPVVYFIVGTINFLKSVPTFIWMILGALVIFLFFLICCHIMVFICNEYVPKCYEICSNRIWNFFG